MSSVHARKRRLREYQVRTNLFASDLQNSQPRKKLTSTTFFFLTPSTPAIPGPEWRLGVALSAAHKNRNTSQFPVASSTDETVVSDEGGGEHIYGVRRWGRGGWLGMTGLRTSVVLRYSNRSRGLTWYMDLGSSIASFGFPRTVHAHQINFSAA